MCVGEAIDVHAISYLPVHGMLAHDKESLNNYVSRRSNTVKYSE